MESKIHYMAAIYANEKKEHEGLSLEDFIQTGTLEEATQYIQRRRKNKTTGQKVRLFQLVEMDV